MPSAAGFLEGDASLPHYGIESHSQLHAVRELHNYPHELQAKRSRYSPSSLSFGSQKGSDENVECDFLKRWHDHAEMRFLNTPVRFEVALGELMSMRLLSNPTLLSCRKLCSNAQLFSPPVEGLFSFLHNSFRNARHIFTDPYQIPYA
jgi:hypothetical protein